MRIKLIIGAIFIGVFYIILLVFDVHPFMYKHNSFHVRIGCVDEDMPSFLQSGKWAYDNPVYFTNNNWATETAIMTTFDVSNDWSGGNNVAYQQRLTDNPSTAIKIAKSLLTYDVCIKYNDSVSVVHKKLQTYRNAHEIPQKKQPKEDCCKPINIK